jgi:L-2-hydroxyglutarate oxidase LhgO
MEQIDAVVIGAGVVGLAVGRALALRGLETLVLEQYDLIGSVTSSRNSEVIHAGIYYPTGSLKARLCVAGRERLYEYCASHGIAHRRCGKLIVASDEAQVADLARIEAQGRANGVADLVRLDAGEVHALEPALAAHAGVLSPSTGIIDSHGLMLALQGDLERAGGVVALRSEVLGLEARSDGIVVRVGGDAPTELLARCVVNAGGLWAPAIAAKTAGLDPTHVPVARYAKGNYCSLLTRAPFRHLVYPIPEAAGLGVHLTLDLGGQARFGPDVEWVEPPAGPGSIDYRVDEARVARFEAAIRRYWPGLPAAALAPAYSGVRPKLDLPAGTFADFVMEGPSAHGVPGLLNLFGIESPGLTASLAIGDEAISRLGL